MLAQLVVMAAPTGADAKDYVLFVCGNLFIAIMAVRSIQYYAKREWGTLFGHLAAGVLVFGIVYANNVFLQILRSFWDLIAGTS
ncbi:hypothetical protein ACXJJ3_42075 (plasmid) [Kribbella sp. WER1]